MIKVIRLFMISLFVPKLALACQSCFGANVNTATTQGIAFAMLGLLGVTGVVSTGIVMFFLNIKKRARLFSQKVGVMDSTESKSETMDQLLDKMNKIGYEELSSQEKELLRKYSDEVGA